MSNAHQAPVTPEVYLRMADESQEKLHYWDGIIFAMAGAKPNHNRIQTNAIRIIGNQLNDPCEVFGSDQRVKISSTKYWYPDAVVACDATFDEISLTNPKVVIEILSPSTAGRDRLDKVSKYTSLKSIDQVVLINQDYRCVESYTRTDSGWQMDRIDTGCVTIADCQIEISDLYKNVQWDEP